MTHVRFVLAMIALGALGCDDGAGGDGSLGGVAGNRRLADLTETETLRLCEGGRDIARMDPPAMRGACFLAASIAISFVGPDSSETRVEVCQTALDRCVSGDGEEPCEPIDFGASCTATVADFRECLLVGADLFRELADDTCEEAALSRVDVAADLEADLGDCNRILNGCFDDADAGM